MTGSVDGVERLVTRTEVAALAGVRRPAVTNWQRRHRDFPRPVGSGEVEYFRLAEIEVWLAGRVIPSNARRPGEGSGATYADRVRQGVRDGVLVDSVGEEQDVPVEPEEVPGRLAELLRFAGRVSGSASGTAYLDLLACLVFLRRSAPARWRELAALSTDENAHPAAAGERLLQRIGLWVDDGLRRRAVVGGMRESLARLEPRSVTDVVRVIQLSARFGVDAFTDLQEHYAKVGRLRVQESCTPRSVARLMGRALTAGLYGSPRVVYDPYARGGELLAAVVAELEHPGPELTVFGESPRRDMLALAGINLAIRGITADLRSSSSVPWHERDRSRLADLVLVNPPFNASGSAADMRGDDKWAYGAPPPTNDNYAWVQHVLASLKPGGRAAVLLPNKATVSTQPPEQRIRRELVDRGAVEGVIALPTQLFAGTPIPACVLLLRYPTERREKVLFIDARARGHRSGAVHVLEENDLAEIEQVLRTHREPESEHPHKAGFTAVCDLTRALNQGCSLYPPDYVNQQDSTPDGYDTADRELAAQAAVDRARARAYEADATIDRLGFDAIAGPWQHRPLSELCEVQSGPSHSRLKGELFPNGEVPVVLPKHLRDRRILPGADGVTQDVAGRLKRFRLMPGDIVCVRSGAAGQTARVGESQAGWLSSTNLLRLHDFHLDRIEPDFLLAYLSRPDVQKWITDRAQATVIPFINAETLGQLPVPLPPLPEQRYIAAALRAADEQITAHRDLAEALDAHRTALAELLLPKPTFAS